MWAEKIAVDCTEMSVFLKSATHADVRVSDNIHFNLEIEMFPLFSLYQQYFKTKADLVNQIEILGKCSPISTKVSKEQFANVMNILSSNLDYDDGFDKYFIFGYEKRSSSTNLVQTYLQLDFAEISLYLQDVSNLPSHFSAPASAAGLFNFSFPTEAAGLAAAATEKEQLFKLSITNAKFMYIKERNDFFEIEFHGMDLFGSYFLHKNAMFLNEVLSEYQEIGFLGELGPVKGSSSNNNNKFFHSNATTATTTAAPYKAGADNNRNRTSSIKNLGRGSGAGGGGAGSGGIVMFKRGTSFTDISAA